VSNEREALGDARSRKDFVQVSCHALAYVSRQLYMLGCLIHQHQMQVPMEDVVTFTNSVIGLTKLKHWDR